MASRELIILALCAVAIETQSPGSLQDVKTVVGKVFKYEVGNTDFHTTYRIQRIVESGKRKLPDWLSFNRNASILAGVPVESDVGMYTMKVKAICRDLLDTCRNRTLTFSLLVFQNQRDEQTGGRNGFILHDDKNLLASSISGNERNDVSMHENAYGFHTVSRKDEPCSIGVTVFYATLILHVEKFLSGLERVFLLQRMCDFLSKNVSVMTLSQTVLDVVSFNSENKNVHIIVAGPGNVVASLQKSFQLTWHVACENFNQFESFARVLQHNIDVGRITKEIGFDVIAWYVSANRPWIRPMKRRKREATATPTHLPPLPTVLSDVSFNSEKELSFKTKYEITSTFSMPETTTPDTVFSATKTTSLINTSRLFSSIISTAFNISYISSTFHSIFPNSVSSSIFSNSFSSLRSKPYISESLLTSEKISSFSQETISKSVDVQSSQFSPLLSSESFSSAAKMSISPTPALSLSSIAASLDSAATSSPFMKPSPSSRLTTLTETSFNGTQILTEIETFPIATVTIETQFPETSFFNASLSFAFYSLTRSLSSSLSEIIFTSISDISSQLSTVLPSFSFSQTVTSINLTINSIISNRFSAKQSSSSFSSVIITSSDIVLPASSSSVIFVSQSDLVLSGTVTLSTSVSSASVVSVSSSTDFETKIITLTSSEFRKISSSILNIYAPNISISPDYLSSFSSPVSSFQSSDTSLDLSSRVPLSSLVVSSASLSLDTDLTFDTSLLSVIPELFTSSSIPESSILSSFQHISEYVSLLTSSSVPIISSATNTSVKSSFSSSTEMFPSFNVSGFSLLTNGAIILPGLTNTYKRTTVYMQSSSLTDSLGSMLPNTPIVLTSRTIKSDTLVTVSSTGTFLSTLLDSDPVSTPLSSLWAARSSDLSSAVMSVFSSAQQTKASKIANTAISPSQPASTGTFLSIKPSSPNMKVTEHVSGPLSSIPSTSLKISEHVPSSMSESLSPSSLDLEISLQISSKTVMASSSSSLISPLDSKSTMHSFAPSKKIQTTFESVDPSFTSVASLELSPSKSSRIVTLLHSIDTSRVSVSNRFNFSSTEIEGTYDVMSTRRESSHVTVFTLNSVKPTPALSFSSVMLSVSISSTMLLVSTTRQPSISTPVMKTKSMSIRPSSSFILPSSDMITTESPDEHPVLKMPIDSLQVHVGRYFEFQIPEDTFSDKEEGGTRNLTLSVTLEYGMPLPPQAWLMFNSTSQTLYGIPLEQDIGDSSILTVTLTATDSADQTIKDPIHLTYNSHLSGSTHKINTRFSGNYQKFVRRRDNLLNLAQKLAMFYNDSDLGFFTFHKMSAGSISVVWSNSSLSSQQCNREEILSVFHKLVTTSGSVSEEFVNFFSSVQKPLSAELEFTGVCEVLQTTLGPGTSPLQPGDDDSKIWIEVVLPALVTILILVIIALILLVFCRHRRPSKDMSASEKPTFLEDRRPIIFPEELEMVDPSLKPKEPLVLPSDYLTNKPPMPDGIEGTEPPRYIPPSTDDEVFFSDDRSQPPPPRYGSTSISDPPPYRLPPPYFNPHRV